MQHIIMSDAPKMLLLLVFITFVMGSRGIKKMTSKDLPALPSTLTKDESSQDVFKKEKGDCYRYERRMAVDGCNMCYCDISQKKFVCTTRVCIYNARMNIHPGTRCFFPMAIYVGYNHTSCRCNEEGQLYDCISRMPSKNSMTISKKHNT